MYTHFETALGVSTCNWLLVIASGVVIVAAATLLPVLLQRWRGKSGQPQP
jgi:hypothetical protein